MLYTFVNQNVKYVCFELNIVYLNHKIYTEKKTKIAFFHLSLFLLTFKSCHIPSIHRFTHIKHKIHEQIKIIN